MAPLKTNPSRPVTICFLMGAGGTGKTTLADMVAENAEGSVGKINEVARTIIRENGISQADLADDDIFRELQVKIAKRQLTDERKYEVSDNTIVISDRSVIDALVYSMMRSSCEVLTDKESTFSLLCELVGSADDASELIQRYRSALCVLVHPFDENDSVDDNVRIMRSSAELATFTAKCHQVLTLFDVPFLELKESSKQGRLELIQEAIRRKIERC